MFASIGGCRSALAQPSPVLIRQATHIRSQIAATRGTPQQARHLDELQGLIRKHVLNELRRPAPPEDFDLQRGLRQLLPGSPDQPLGWVYCAASTMPMSPSRCVLYAVVYTLETGIMGPHGSRVVVQAFLVRNSQPQYLGAAGRELAGFVLQPQRLYPPPDRREVWLLALGDLTGGSGANLPRRAVLYLVSPTGISSIWDSGLLYGLQVKIEGSEFTAEHFHADCACWQHESFVVEPGSPSRLPTLARNRR